MKKIIIFLILLIPINVEANYSESVVDVFSMNIYEIQEAVDRGYINYELLAKLYLERIETYESSFNSIITLNENILEEARVKDIEYKKDGRISILHGIPLIIKDNIDVLGMPTTAGSKALLKNYPLKNAELVQKLIDQGALVMAKSNMSEFAFSATNSYSSYGHVRNAYDMRYSSYGSSGGTAVAVALGFATAGIGTDTNSSIRMPASAAALVGLRPTYGSVSSEGIIPYDKERDVAGPIARNSIDAAIIFQAISDDFSMDFKEDLSDYKIGVLVDFFQVDAKSSLKPYQATYKPISDLMQEMLNILVLEGAELIEIENLYNKYYDSIKNSTYSGVLFCYDFNQYIKGTEGPIKNYNDLLRGGGYIQNLSYYNVSCNYDLRNVRIKAINQKKDQFKEKLQAQMDSYGVDVLLYPTTKNRLILLSESGANSMSSLFAPVTGMPAINLAIGFVDNLPYGMEVLARHNEEALLLNIGNVIESNTLFYHLSKQAPMLYQVSEEKVVLKELYDQFYLNDEYQELNEKARKIFLNQLDFDSKIILDYKNHHVPIYESSFSFNVFDYERYMPLTIVLSLIYTNFLVALFNKRK